MRLSAPENWQQATIFGQLYVIDDDGAVEVADPRHAAELRSFGFTDFVEPAPAADPDPRLPAGPVADEFDGLNRNGLFDWARAHGLRMPTPITLDQQRAACRAHAAKLAAERDAAQESADLLREAEAKRAAELAEAQAKAGADAKAAAQAEAQRIADEAAKAAMTPPAPPPLLPPDLPPAPLS